MNGPLLQPFRPPLPGLPDADASFVQLLSVPIAPQVARWKSEPPDVSIATVVPSMVTPDAFFSVYVSLPLICGIVSAELMNTTFAPRVTPQKVWNAVFVALRAMITYPFDGIVVPAGIV